ncbi:unnamed protein product [Spirodela intermedia]|uniref:Uncharacterized protein n=1 Tax=Spirodela intermedia TaxID=51605 RepID=A0A7I8JW21_SPIIN|nr:unnamed protein product [Spirodela intermedia]CAA6673853.1 unnamed protein product [Spirodela intermedia]
MANLRMAMDAAFWDVNLASPQSLVDGVVRAVPGEPVPLDGARAGGQYAPSNSPSSTTHSHWALRRHSLISSIKSELANADELDLVALRDVAKHLLDKSLYAIGLCSQFSPTPDTSLLFSIEGHGEKEKSRSKATFIHKLPNHDVTVEAAWPELFIDKNGKYWDVPSSLSLDVASLVSDSGLRYRFGLHKSSGHPQPLNSSGSDDKIPLALMPGFCAKAALSYEKNRDFWREKDKDSGSNLEKEMPWLSPYDERLKEPHASISAILEPKFQEKEESIFCNVFGSMCYTVQHGKFTEDFNDLTRLDARWTLRQSRHLLEVRLVCCMMHSEVRLSRRQVAGPIVVRVDSRLAFTSPSGKHAPNVEDIMYSLSYSLRILRSGKILAWYSPKRKKRWLS